MLNNYVFYRMSKDEFLVEYTDTNHSEFDAKFDIYTKEKRVTVYGKDLINHSLLEEEFTHELGGLKQVMLIAEELDFED